MSISPQSRHARRLAAALEPVVGQVYFSPECHAAYVALGFEPSSGEVSGVALPDGPAYFASRGSLLGQVPGEVIAASFGVFNPAVVVPMVEFAWSRTDADTIRRARSDGAVAQLRRILGDEPDGAARAGDLMERATADLRLGGRTMAAGVTAREVPDGALAKAWHLGDLLREYRGDSHNATWLAAGLTATEIGVLTELYWGLGLRTYSRTRGWTEAQFDDAEASLRERGWLEGGQLSPAGRAGREELEVATDSQMDLVLAALGSDLDELCSVLERWGSAVRAGRGYLPSGPHDLAAR
jgi:hypothetical protein